MNTKTINSTNILSLFLCLLTTISYCPSIPTPTLKLQICSRTLALLGLGAGSGVLGNKAVEFRLEELERHREIEKEKAQIETFIKKDKKEKEEYLACFNMIQESKKRNSCIDSQSKN